MPESIMDFMHSDKILLVSARFNKHEVGGGGGGRRGSPAGSLHQH